MPPKPEFMHASRQTYVGHHVLVGVGAHALIGSVLFGLSFGRLRRTFGSTP